MRRAQLQTTGTALSRSTFACEAEPQSRAGLSPAALGELLGRPVPAGSTVRSFTATRADHADSTVTPRAHVAYLARAGTRPPSLAIVRDFGGGHTDVRVVERK